MDLIGVCVENPAVFEDTHGLIFDLVKSGRFSGLRIDHIDGLYNPGEYLGRVRENLSDTYLLVEKILTDNEQLPDSWPVEGTTGYDFLNRANEVFVREGSVAEIDAFYKQFSGKTQAFSELLHASKKQVIQNYFLGDVRNLARLVNGALRKTGFPKKLTQRRLIDAVVELLACFPVYRTYIDKQRHDCDPFKLALSTAKQRNPQLTAELASIVYLLGESEKSPDALHVIMRLQQFTGAITAKGLEDTAFYRYSRFISLNEVGSDPARFGCSVQEFHEFNCLRQQKWPLTLNASSTHDTKRGEDVRARLNVISEIPNEFENNVKKWSDLNVGKKRRVNRKFAPNRGEEYYLYQTMLGAFPWDATAEGDFAERLKLHMVKALREAKNNSNWLSPNLQYEQTVTTFIDEILGNTNFQESFLPMQRKIGFYGFFNSLSQTLLKITCPGIPDFYQGTELWNLNLVDPDNRRPVNFWERQKLLSEISKIEPSKAASLLDSYGDGKAKLYLIYRALEFRKKMKELFCKGAYIPLAVEGVHQENVIAFSRRKGNFSAVVVVPRFLTGLIKPQSSWRNDGFKWADTCIQLPPNAPSKWTDALTERTIHTQSNYLPASDVSSVFPVALLFSGDLHG